MPRRTESKTGILDEAGYAYSFDRQLYINRKTKKAFSVEFIQDHGEDQLRKSIRELPVDGTEILSFSCISIKELVQAHGAQ